MSCPSPLPVQGSPREGCIIIKKPLALFSEIYYYMICAWGYSSVGERSVRIRKAVSSNLIISIKQPASSGRLLSKITSYVCSSVDRALDSGSRCAGSTPVRRVMTDITETWYRSFHFLRYILMKAKIAPQSNLQWNLRQREYKIMYVKSNRY